MFEVKVGDRIYYTGDRANWPSEGTVTSVSASYSDGCINISYDDERFEGDVKKCTKGLPLSAFSPGPGRRFYLLSEWQAQQQAQLESLALLSVISLNNVKHGGSRMQKKRLVFYNISNHPSSNWDVKQVEAAKKLLLKSSGLPFVYEVEPPVIIDVPFPVVSPTASIKEVADLAWKVRTQIKTQDTIVLAMIMGEMCLTHKLVNLLSREGIGCVAATTEREVVEKEGVKTSVFKFVQFRSY